jgi:transposase-like protein
MYKLIKEVFVNRRGEGSRKSTEPYDLKLKTRIIKKYLQGDVSFKMLSRQYNIHPGVMSRWVRVIKTGRPELKQKKISKFTGMSEDKRLQELLQQNKKLQRELEDERIRAGLYKKMIEIAERDLGIPIEKKYGARRSTSTGKPQEDR